MRLNGRSALVVGASGFIGSNLKRALEGNGYLVVGVDHSNSPKAEIDTIDLLKFQPEVCYFAAGTSNVAESFKDPGKDYYSNVTVAQQWLESISRYSKQTKFVYLSSAAVYGNAIVSPITEASELNPISPYGKNKLRAEEICREFHKTGKVQSASVRIFSAYGKGLKKQLFWDLHQKMKSQAECVLFGTGDEQRDFIHISDLVSALILISSSNLYWGSAVNLASGTSISISQAARLFGTILNYRGSIIFNGQQRIGDPSKWSVDIQKLKQSGFEAKTLISDGLRDYIQWLDA